MNEKANIEYFRDKGMLPFQAEFAVNFFNKKDTQHWELVAPVGTGKTRLGTLITAHELEESNQKRILVLTPAAILDQWQYELSRQSSILKTCTPVIVNRSTYLELESKVPVDESPWPFQTIILMSIDLAKRDDMASSLCKVVWDLVIVDESHILSGNRKLLIERLIKAKAACRTLLLTATYREVFDKLVKKVIVKHQDIVDWEGRAIFAAFEKKLTAIHYKRTPDEVTFLNELQDFTSKLSEIWSYGKFYEARILRAASSSVYSTDKVLRRLHDVWSPMRNKIAHQVPWSNEDLERLHHQFTTFADEPEESDDLLETNKIEPHQFLILYQKLNLLLDRIQEIEKDPKLDVLISYIEDHLNTNDKFYLCIWSSFMNTVNYISTSIQDFGKPLYLLMGSMETVEIMQNIEAFRESGGILITTDAGSSGITLEYVDECINYDLPSNRQAFEQRWGRFLRFGREKDFKMVILEDETSSLTFEEKIITLL